MVVLEGGLLQADTKFLLCIRNSRKQDHYCNGDSTGDEYVINSGTSEELGTEAGDFNNNKTSEKVRKIFQFSIFKYYRKLKKIFGEEYP